MFALLLETHIISKIFAENQHNQGNFHYFSAKSAIQFVCVIILCCCYNKFCKQQTVDLHRTPKNYLNIQNKRKQWFIDDVGKRNLITEFRGFGNLESTLINPVKAKHAPAFCKNTTK